MDEEENSDASLTHQIEQLQRERDELRKDIEQTASLEQEIESLNKKLARCKRDKQNLQEDLSEAYRIESQLADLHSAEDLKNKEAEKQLKFFQSSVAAVFAERDQALMKSEKAKEHEDTISQKLTELENSLTMNDMFLHVGFLRRRIRDMYYAAQWISFRATFEWYEKGLDIEHHLKRKVKSLEREQIVLDDMIKNGLSTLHDFQKQQRMEVTKILEGETIQLKSILVEIQNKFSQIHMERELKIETLQGEKVSVDTECRDVHITSDIDSSVLPEKDDLPVASSITKTLEASDGLSQALEEKVAALLLLSQQEERHLLESDVNKALQKKVEELQRNLSQVTNEKVNALMELAQLKESINYCTIKIDSLVNVHLLLRK
ncbi:hypothetical protein J5N97_016961 [Dioscorea zingiberensis]|uniref:Uncharacterized protein n=1 Tax=Dioscorea zingiberensis TaxID=325984 RepID=A0A9D5CKJ1_9LILI|nr:hypothetical protein J5N97_016961 [Dioscorea zingiberensis]